MGLTEIAAVLVIALVIACLVGGLWAFVVGVGFIARGVKARIVRVKPVPADSV